MIRWGILGPGFIATRAIIPAIQGSRNGRVLALASRDQTRAQSIAAQWNIERAYGDYQALLDDPSIDAVYIALPNHLHCPWTIQAAQAGKHVLCEKPLACSAREGEQMLEACQNARVQLMEAAMYRFHPRMRRLRQLVDDGVLGQLRFLHSSFTFPLNSPQNYRLSSEYGGGALLDVGYYCVNALCWLSSAVPTEIQVFQAQREPGGVDLHVSALLRFADDVLVAVPSSGARKDLDSPSEEKVYIPNPNESSGNALGHFQCSFIAAEHQAIELVGSRGAVTAPLAFTAWRNDPTMLYLQQGSQFVNEEFAPTDPYQLMVEHFVEVVQGQTGICYGPQEAIQMLGVIDEIRSRM